MKEDLFKKLAEKSEAEFLKQKELQEVMGGLGDIVIIKNPFLGCGGSKNTLDWCPGDACDPINLGACPGNTVMGGPRTCPLSE